MATEKRLIDANKLEKLVVKHSAAYFHRDDIIAAIAAQPTVDAVEVVRCGECRFCDTEDCPMRGTPGEVSASDFCSYGERRTDNEKS